MSGELIHVDGSEFLASPEKIGGHEFRASMVYRRYDNYYLYGFNLLPGWQKEIPRLLEQDKKRLGELLENMCVGTGLEWRMIIDSQTGLVAEIGLSDGNQKSKVTLEGAMGHDGEYGAHEVRSLSSAVIYQEFLARYLSFITDFKVNYPYIFNGGYSKCGSADLKVPEKFMVPKGGIWDEYNQNRFSLKAANIAGQFGLTVRQPLTFDKNGILTFFQIEERNACTYDLHGMGNTYAPHNVDNIWQAAALHGIGAGFINELLKRDSQEAWR